MNRNKSAVASRTVDSLRDRIVERERAAKLSGKLNVSRTRTIVGERNVGQTIGSNCDLEEVGQRTVAVIEQTEQTKIADETQQP